VRNCAVIFLIAGALGAGRALAADSVPATQPVSESATIQPESSSLATTPVLPATQAGNSSSVVTTAPATQPDFTRTADAPAFPATAPSTNPAPPSTASIAATGPATRPIASAAAPPAAGGGTGPQSFSGSPGYGSAPPILPHEYFVLAVRSIFQKGSHVTRGFDSPTRSGLSSSSSSTPSAVPATATASVAPEESLVFEGAMETGNQFLAFVEDRNVGKMLMLQSGQSIARGKITAITLNTLDYVSDGAVLHVQIGQNLRGEAPTSPSDSTVSTGSAATPSSGTTSGDNSAAGAGGSTANGGNDILERLRRRRQQELQGK